MNETPWILTDEDTNQYGRHLGGMVYEFKQDVAWPPDFKTETHEATIDLGQYSLVEWIEHVEPFGYTLSGLLAENGVDGTRWIIAECIFENEITN